MKAPWQTYVMCLFFRHLGGKIDTAYFILRATGRSGPENML